MTKRTGLILLCSLLCILLVCVLAFCSSPNQGGGESTTPQTTAVDIATAVQDYNGLVAAYNDSVSTYNESLHVVAEENTALDAVIADAQAVLDAGEIPFDPQTKTDLEQAIQTATMARVAVPDPLPLREELTAPEGASTEENDELLAFIATESVLLQNPEIPDPLTAPNYTTVTTALLDAQTAYERSVQIQKQVTAPSDDFVLERLKQIDSILSLAAVTASNDPNGLLGKEGGYIGCIYFSDSRVDKTELDLKPGQYDVISMGTIGGGAIEIYATIEEAEARNDYLSTYDETELDPGSHIVIGTMVIRTSSKLTDDQQTDLTNQIVACLTELVEE